MRIDAIAKFVYGLMGTAFLVGGAAVMSLHTGFLPQAAKDFIIGFAHGDMLAVHLIQELASLLVFAGLISFWFIRHYRFSGAFHWSMTVFWALFAFAHWVDGREGPRAVKGPIINTIPLAVFLIIGLLRSGSQSRARQ